MCAFSQLYSIYSTNYFYRFLCLSFARLILSFGFSMNNLHSDFPFGFAMICPIRSDPLHWPYRGRFWFTSFRSPPTKCRSLIRSPLQSIPKDSRPTSFATQPRLQFNCLTQITSRMPRRFKVAAPVPTITYRIVRRRNRTKNGNCACRRTGRFFRSTIFVSHFDLLKRMIIG